MYALYFDINRPKKKLDHSKKVKCEKGKSF